MQSFIYLNQDNPQPRERDYSYVGSFFAFSIWIGIGTAAISEWISQKLKNRNLAKKNNNEFCCITNYFHSNRYG